MVKWITKCIFFTTEKMLLSSHNDWIKKEDNIFGMLDIHHNKV